MTKILIALGLIFSFLGAVDNAQALMGTPATVLSNEKCVVLIKGDKCYKQCGTQPETEVTCASVDVIIVKSPGPTPIPKPRLGIPGGMAQ